ncbi:hypothetical protein F511_39486 [Dorcoceras hygrometricum]|uniref:Uncharacterized protein n=1 Tax=Dorcoceras hygrometricum TaxID=472368 RepID=A0A2Z7B7F6_9LAMI|nr:hypothetical protein F511_39486 [Dorcoceras hygrometricum]
MGSDLLSKGSDLLSERSGLQQTSSFSATQIQQRRKFSSNANSAVTQTSSSPRKNSDFSTRSKILEQKASPRRNEGIKGLKWRTLDFLTSAPINTRGRPQNSSQHFEIHSQKSNISSRQSPAKILADFLAKVLRKLRRSPGVLLPDFPPCTFTIQRVRDLEIFRAIDLLPKLRTKIPDFVLPYFTRKLELFLSHSNSACTDFCYRNMGLRNISDSGLLGVTTWPRPLRGVMGLRNIPHSGLLGVTTWPRPLRGVKLRD